MLTALEEQKIVAVIRADDVDQAVKISEACINGGINIIELTYSIPRVEAAVEKLLDLYKGNDEVVIGVGTVLDPYTAREAIFA